MSKKKIKRNPRSMARKWALMYLYQTDITEKKFEESDFELFVEQIDNAPSAPNQFEREKGYPFAKELIQGVLNNTAGLDEKISVAAQNWKIDRMAAVDRNILRLAAYELMEISSNHALVIVNEAIELAKMFA